MRQQPTAVLEKRTLEEKKARNHLMRAVVKEARAWQRFYRLLETGPIYEMRRVMNAYIEMADKRIELERLVGEHDDEKWARRSFHLKLHDNYQESDAHELWPMPRDKTLGNGG